MRYASSLGNSASARITRRLQGLSQVQYALLLALIGLALVCCAVGTTPAAYAYASEPAGQLTVVSQDETSRSYSAYQLIAGEVDGENLLTASFDGCVPESVWTSLGAPSTETDALAMWLNAQLAAGGVARGEFLDSLRDAVLASGAASYTTFSTGQTVSLPQGYWLLASGKARPELVLISAGQSTTMVEKATVPSADKQIYNDHTGDWGNSAALEVGKPLRYRIIGTLPSNIDEYVTYTYWFVDTPGAGLTLNPETVTAEIVHEDGSTTVLPLEVQMEGDTMLVGADDIKAMHNSWAPTDRLAVEYTANVSAEALRSGIVPNEVEVEYTNQPDMIETGTTTTTLAYAITYNVDTFKVEEGTTTPLAGAQFTLQNSDGFYLSNNDAWVEAEGSGTTYTTDESGHAAFSGLGAGTYTLTEVAAPSGYVALSRPVEITITPNADDASVFDVTVSGTGGATLLGVDGTSLTANVQIDDPKSDEPTPSNPGTPGTPTNDTPTTPAVPSNPVAEALGKILPKTGDYLGMTIFALVVAAAVGALAAIIAAIMKRRKDESPPGG